MGEATIASKKENLIWLAKNCKQREENNQRMSEHYDAEATSLSKVITILDSEDMFINFLQTKEAPKYQSDEYFLFQDVIDECQKQIGHIDEEGRADAEKLEECKTSEASKIRSSQNKTRSFRMLTVSSRQKKGISRMQR